MEFLLCVLLLTFCHTGFGSAAGGVSRPALVVNEVVDEGDADFSGSQPKIVETSCGLECLEEEMKKATQTGRLSDLFSYETLYENGSVSFTKLDVDLNNVDMEYLSKNRRGNSRNKREVYGYDTRFLLTDKDYLMQYPFNTVVKLSTGCSGTLIGQKYVLTAARCVHDGVTYIKGTKNLRVGFRRDRDKESGPEKAVDDDRDFYWIRSTEVKIPQGWKASNGLNLASEYDYAVIRLKRKHDNDFMDIGVGSRDVIYPGRRVHFSAYDDDNSTDLMYRFCPISEDNSDLIYHYCDSKASGVGAGMYIRVWDSLTREWKRKVVGVFNGHMWVESRGSSDDFNVAVLITPLKYAQLCFWLEGDYSSCNGRN